MLLDPKLNPKTPGRSVDLAEIVQGVSIWSQCKKRMSALPLKADIAEVEEHVRFVPEADSCGAAKKAIRSPGLQAREDCPEW
jgi:hypothetical protein